MRGLCAVIRTSELQCQGVALVWLHQLAGPQLPVTAAAAKPPVCSAFRGFDAYVP